MLIPKSAGRTGRRDALHRSPESDIGARRFLGWSSTTHWLLADSDHNQ
jgi:hypothetical protein